MKLFLLSLISIFLLNYSGREAHASKHLGRKIGEVKGNTFNVIIDTVEYKGFLERNILSVPEAKLDRIEIIKSTTVGDRRDDFYMLIAYDKSLNLKSTHWLVRDNDAFYFFENKSLEEVPNEIFFGTFFTCYGSESDCYPLVSIYDDEYAWTTSEERVCNPNSPCKGSTAYIFAE